MMKVDIQTIQAKDEILARLPEQIIELSEIIGLNATLNMVEHLGGLSFDVPSTLDTKNGKWLSSIIGIDNAKKLIAYYGGDSLYVNNCDALRIHLRNAALVSAIFAKMETGTSRHRAVQETAPEFGITERRAYDILKQMTQSQSQLPLLF